MLQAMYNGVSAIEAHQESMDVIGNNIANVNTTAYKAAGYVSGSAFTDAAGRQRARPAISAAPTRSRSASASGSAPSTR